MKKKYLFNFEYYTYSGKPPVKISLLKKGQKNTILKSSGIDQDEAIYNFLMGFDEDVKKSGYNLVIVNTPYLQGYKTKQLVNKINSDNSKGGVNGFSYLYIDSVLYEGDYSNKAKDYISDNKAIDFKDNIFNFLKGEKINTNPFFKGVSYHKGRIA